MPQTSFHYQQLVPYICCVDLLVAFPSYRDVCSLFIPYWDSLVCTFLQAPLLYLNCSTFSLSGPGTWLPEAPANSTAQLKWFGTHFSQRPSVSYTSIHAPDICIYLCLIWAHLEFLQMFLYLNHTLRREGKETRRGRRCVSQYHIYSEVALMPGKCAHRSWFFSFVLPSDSPLRKTPTGIPRFLTY